MKTDLKKLFADDPDMLNVLEKREQSSLLRQLLDATKAKSVVEVNAGFLKGERGEIGPVGPQGERGEASTIPGPKGETGKPGRNGIGINGKDGKDGSPDTPAQIATKLNTTTESLEQSVIKDFPTIEKVIKELKKKQYLEPKDIKGMPINMNDMRWHGAGAGHVIQDEGVPLAQRSDLNFVGPGVSVADSGGKTVVTISGSAATFIDNEVVAGSGTSWTLAGTPTLGSEHIYGNGQRLIPGGVDYTIVGAVITTVNSFASGSLLADYRM